MKQLRARIDPSFEARVLCREPLVYRDGPDSASDRPAFVRAASGLAWLGDSLAIVQDDASFIALRRPDGSIDAVPLPRGPGGRRRFEERLGNKMDKLDLESCIALERTLLCFGSGSLPVRERIVMMAPDEGSITIVDATELYASLRNHLGLEPAELNLEGVAVCGPLIRLFHRGNGRRFAGGGSGSADVEAEELVRYLDRGPCPSLRHLTHYDLGSAGTVPYGITDATSLPDGRLIVLAAAEDSPDAIADGQVHGALVGVLVDDDLRVCPLCDASGEPTALKAEGIAMDPEGYAWVVVDPDDPDRPAELCRVELRGVR